MTKLLELVLWVMLAVALGAELIDGLAGNASRMFIDAAFAGLFVILIGLTRALR